MAQCERKRELQAFHDGEVSPRQSEQLERHVQQCPECAEELQQLRELSRLFQDARRATMPAGMLERIKRNVCDQYASDGNLIRIAGWLTAAAAAVLVVGVSLLWQHSGAANGYTRAEYALDSFTVNQMFEGSGATLSNSELAIAIWIMDEL